MSPRQLTPKIILAASGAVILAAVVFAGTLAPSPPTPLPPVSVSVPAPPVPPTPAVKGVRAVPAPPAVPRIPPSRRDLEARISGETITVREDGENWIIDDAEIRARIEAIVSRHQASARRALEDFERACPAIERAQAMARQIEISFDEAGFEKMALDIARQVERATREAEIQMRAHEESMRSLEVEMEKLETHMEKFEAEMERFEDEMEELEEMEWDEDADANLGRIIRDAIRSGKASRVN
ncbi:MAG TPA: hypothetical protein VM557_03850 [Thermoanaerobaculia bacterium]|nr:hypothetical protein [Thermoanaerobaculia bacterium]